MEPVAGTESSTGGRAGTTFPAPFYRWRPHPWHGLDAGPDPPRVVHAHIELTPFDLVKYEVDKTTGYIRVDRPQRSSSQPPTPGEDVQITIERIFGREHALTVVGAALEDYVEEYGQ